MQRTPKPVPKVAPAAIAVLAMSSERGLTLGFRCSPAEFRRLFRPYTDDPAILLAEARAWPMCTRLFGGEVFAHGLKGAPGQKAWSASPRQAPRVTLVEAAQYVGLKPTYRILTRTAFVTAMATRWSDTANVFDWLVENRGWMTDDNVTAYGAPLVWVEGDERAVVVEQLVALRESRTDQTATSLIYREPDQKVLLALVSQLPDGSTPTSVVLHGPQHWLMRGLLGVVRDDREPLALDGKRTESLRALAARIEPGEYLRITAEDLRALRTTVSCEDCAMSLSRGDAWWDGDVPRCARCEEVVAPIRIVANEERKSEREAARARDLSDLAERRASYRLTPTPPSPRRGINLATVLGFVIGREIGRRD